MLYIIYYILYVIYYILYIIYYVLYIIYHIVYIYIYSISYPILTTGENLQPLPVQQRASMISLARRCRSFWEMPGAGRLATAPGVGSVLI